MPIAFEMVIGAGQTYAAEGEQTIDAKWKKVVFSFRFKHDGFINDEIFTDVYTVQPVIYTFTKDGEERRHDECEVFETPEDAMLVMLRNTKVKQVKPNQNPNTIYFTSNPRPAGLDEALVVSNTDNMLIFNTAYDAFLTKEAIPTFVAEAGIQHTFTAEETNCWLPLAFPYNNLMGDEVKDVATGEDVTSKIKFYSLSTARKVRYKLRRTTAARTSACCALTPRWPAKPCGLPMETSIHPYSKKSCPPACTSITTIAARRSRMSMS